jgi:TP901 family phage tail tape measure protein
MAKINKIINVKVEGVGKIKQLEESLKKLRKQQRDIKKDMKDGANAGKNAEKQYKKNENAIKGQSKALRETKKAMLDANNTTKKATSLQNSMTMGVIKGAAAFSILVTAFRRVNQALTTMIGTFQEFEFTMAKVKAVSGATDDEFKKLSDSAQELGRSTFFTASEVANLQLNLSKLGFTTAEVLEATEATINLSIATGSDLARAATVAGNAVRGFQLDATETGRVVDVMAVAFTSSALDIEKWQTSMTKVAPIATMAGFTIEETTAIMAKLADTGIEASIAGTSLRNILLKMQDPTSELTRKVGHTIHSMGDMLKVFKDMQDEGTDLGDVLTFMDVRQVAAFGTMLRGADDVEELTEKLNEAAGAGDKMAGIVGDTLEGSILKVKSAFQGLSIAIVEKFGGALKKSFVSLAKWLNQLVKDEKKLKKLWDTIIFVTKAIGYFVVGLIPARMAIKAFAAETVGATIGMRTWAGAIAIARGALLTLTTAIASTGIGFFIIALGSLASSFMSVNEAVTDFNPNLTRVNDAFVSTQVEIEKVRISTKSLIKSKEEMAKIMKKEGDNLEDNAVATEKYNRLKVQEKIDVDNLNKVLKIHNKELIDENTNIQNIKDSTNELITAMTQRALANIFIDLQAGIVKAKVESDVIVEKLKEFAPGGLKAPGSADKYGIGKSVKKEGAGPLGMDVWESDYISLIEAVIDDPSLIGGGGDLSSPSDRATADRVNNLMSLLEQYNMTPVELLSALSEDYVETETRSLEGIIKKRSGGIDVLSLLSSQSSGGEEECEEGWEWSPKDGRCVKIKTSAKYTMSQLVKKQEAGVSMVGNQLTIDRKMLEAKAIGIQAFLDQKKLTGEEEINATLAQTKNLLALNKAKYAEELKDLTDAKDAEKLLLQSDAEFNLLSKEEQNLQLLAIDEQFEIDKKDAAERNKQEVNDIENKIAQQELERAKLERDSKVSLLDDQYETDQLNLDEALANKEITEMEHQQFMLMLEAAYLLQKHELYAGSGEEQKNINKELKRNTIETTEAQIAAMNDYISSVGDLGQQMQDLAGDEEKLSGLRKVGMVVTKAAATAEKILAIATTINTLATKKKTIAEVIDVAMTGKVVAANLKKTISNISTAASGFIATVSAAAKSIPFPLNLLAIAATYMAIKGVVKKIKSSFGVGGGAGMPSDSGGSSGGSSGGGRSSSGAMSYYTYGGQHSTYANGGMVYGNSHAQGGEKFAVGGRVVELEGGEAVINKRSTSMFRSQLSAMNSAGGGVKFADGGVTNNPSFAKTQFDVTNQSSNRGSSRVVVVEADITSTQNTIKTIEAEASF